MKSQRYALIGIILLSAILLSVGAASGFITDWMWFSAEGYGQVFWKSIAVQFTVGIGLGLLAALFLLSNALWAARHDAIEPPLRGNIITIEPKTVRAKGRSAMSWGVIALCLVCGAVFGLRASVWWRDFILFLNGSNFEYTDPVFSRDASFYIFTLPILTHMANFLTVLTGLSAALCLGLYAIRGAFVVSTAMIAERIVPTGVTAAPAARSHLAAHVAVLLVLLMFGVYLNRFTQMYDQSGLFAGPGYAEINGKLPLMLALAAAILLAAPGVYAGIVRFDLRWIAGPAALALAVLMLATFYPRFIQRFRVLPNELNRERDYIVEHVKATRFAFGLDKVQSKPLEGDATLTPQDVKDNKTTLENVRLWDHLPLLETFSQVQEIRTYYDFTTVDNDRYMIGGQLRQMMLSARELQVKSLPNRTWVNEMMSYTHGYGLAMGPVNQVTNEGLPELFVKDLPPKSLYPELEIRRPEIYFGELTQGPVFVKTNSKEFDYPAGEDNVYAVYEGKGGVGVGNLLKRILFAIRFADLKILLTSDFTSETRIMFRRNIRERVNRVAPFFSYDDDPYLVVSEGRLFWMMDGYTLSGRFPYAQGIPRIGNYIRNSVKVIVDAYDGSMKFYSSDSGDPIARAWSQAFPSLVRPLSEMPPDLRAHMRYPEDLFKIQAYVFETYHMEDPQIFYNREDQWQTPVLETKEGRKEMTPYFTIMKLPGGEKEEFIQMLPFTPRAKNNLAAWMAARSDGEHYGQLVVYRFPKERLVYGPSQIIARINQDEKISPQVSLWNQQGSEVLWGTLLVIPIKEALIYVMPLYLRATNGRIPELKRVIAGYENRIAMAPTLEEALIQIFNPGASVETGSEPAPQAPPAVGSSPSSEPLNQLTARAKTHYDAATQAARDGDWARYGTEIKALGEAIESLSGWAEPPAQTDPAPLPK